MIKNIGLLVRMSAREDIPQEWEEWGVAGCAVSLGTSEVVNVVTTSNIASLRII